MATERLIGPFSQIVTLRGLSDKGAIKDDQLEVISSGGVLVRDGHILEVGKFEDLRKKASSVDEVETTVVFYFQDSWIATPTWCGLDLVRVIIPSEMPVAPTRKFCLREVEFSIRFAKRRRHQRKNLFLATIARANRHLAEGVTTVEVKSGYGLIPEQEVKILQVVSEVGSQVPADLIPTCLAAHVCPKEYSIGEFLSLLENELFPLLKSGRLANRVDIFVEEKAFLVAVARGIPWKGEEIRFSDYNTRGPVYNRWFATSSRSGCFECGSFGGIDRKGNCCACQIGNGLGSTTGSFSGIGDEIYPGPSTIGCWGFGSDCVRLESRISPNGGFGCSGGHTRGSMKSCHLLRFLPGLTFSVQQRPLG